MKKWYATITGFLVFSACFAQSIPTWKITDLEKYMQQSDTSLVVNFWATWCEPCVKELPWFLEAAAKNKGKFNLLLVSLDMKRDYPDKIARFVQEKNIQSTVVWLDETNADYFCPRIDPSWSGSLPATYIINRKTGKRSFYEKTFKEDELQKLLEQFD
ncbi:MAG: TlpA family protein disulfide reductase [Chitinophagaceae bacterium]|nr:TlpA family protein disulfide reductase [Chitinophagaceae bacterium]